jgi:hypothetical protein
MQKKKSGKAQAGIVQAIRLGFPSILKEAL